MWAAIQYEFTHCPVMSVPGYAVSESVYFGPRDWLPVGEVCFRESQASCEPTVFSMDRLLWSIANDSRCSVETLRAASAQLQRCVGEELELRARLRDFGVGRWERVAAADAKKRRRSSPTDQVPFAGPK